MKLSSQDNYELVVWQTLKVFFSKNYLNINVYEIFKSNLDGKYNNPT